MSSPSHFESAVAHISSLPSIHSTLRDSKCLVRGACLQHTLRLPVCKALARAVRAKGRCTMPALLSTLPVLPAGSNLTLARSSPYCARSAPLWGLPVRPVYLRHLNARRQQRGGRLTRGATQPAQAASLRTDVADVSLESLLQVRYTSAVCLPGSHPLVTCYALNNPHEPHELVYLSASPSACRLRATRKEPE